MSLLTNQPTSATVRAVTRPRCCSWRAVRRAPGRGHPRDAGLFRGRGRPAGPATTACVWARFAQRDPGARPVRRAAAVTPPTGGGAPSRRPPLAKLRGHHEKNAMWLLPCSCWRLLAFVVDTTDGHGRGRVRAAASAGGAASARRRAALAATPAPATAAGAAAAATSSSCPASAGAAAATAAAAASALRHAADAGRGRLRHRDGGARRAPGAGPARADGGWMGQGLMGGGRSRRRRREST